MVFRRLRPPVRSEVSTSRRLFVLSRVRKHPHRTALVTDREQHSRLALTSSQTLIFSSRSWKYSFQLSGSAATCKTRRTELTSGSRYLLSAYRQVTSETGTPFGSRAI